MDDGSWIDTLMAYLFEALATAIAVACVAWFLFMLSGPIVAAFWDARIRQRASRREQAASRLAQELERGRAAPAAWTRDSAAAIAEVLPLRWVVAELRRPVAPPPALPVRDTAPPLDDNRSGISWYHEKHRQRSGPGGGEGCLLVFAAIFQVIAWVIVYGMLNPALRLFSRLRAQRSILRALSAQTGGLEALGGWMGADSSALRAWALSDLSVREAVLLGGSNLPTAAVGTPSGVDADRVLGAGLRETAEVAAGCGADEGAVGLFERSIAVLERYRQRTDVDVGLLRELSLSYEALGELYAHRDSAEQALSYYESALALEKQIAALRSAAPGGDVAIAAFNVATTLDEIGADSASAWKRCIDSIVQAGPDSIRAVGNAAFGNIAEWLASRSTETSSPRSLAEMHDQFGRFFEAERDLDAARVAFRTAAHIAQRTIEGGDATDADLCALNHATTSLQRLLELQADSESVPA